MADLLGVGCATVDDFLRVDVFPTADTKQEVLSEDRQGGGLIPTALVAAARLGLRCEYFDVLGDDALSRWVLDDLARERIDVSPVRILHDARPIHAVIIVTSDGGRTILYSTAGRVMADEDVPGEEALQNVKVLLLDDVNTTALAGLTRLVAASRRRGTPVVADFERAAHRPLIEQVDHLIVSQRWAASVTGVAQPAAAASALWTPTRSAVVITCGAEGAWYMDAATPPTHMPAFRTAVVDTTGCGDVFHGVYAASLAEGLPLAERVRWASAAAALKATKAGGRPGIPNRPQIEALLALQ